MQRVDEKVLYFLYRRFLVSYKKNTLAVFFSFALTFLLSTVLLVLIHTDHKIENINYQTKFSPSDCYIDKLTKQQVKQLEKFPDIVPIGITQDTEQYSRNLQTVYLTKGDDAYITMTAKLIEGSMPRAENEVAAEEWVLLNLGIEPVLNQEFDLSVFGEDEKAKTVKLVGILSDLPKNKMYGILELYTMLDKEEAEEYKYTCNIRFKENVNDKEKLKELQSELKIRKKQIHHNPAREDYEELFRIDVQLISVVLFVCMVVFYGVYRIAQITREKQYGILRAIGMKQKQLKYMILLELYQIYCIGAPVGIGIGLLLAWGIVKISGDGDTIVYLYNQSVRFTPVVPVKQICFLVVITAVLVGLVGYFAGRKAVRKPVMELLSSEAGNGISTVHKSYFFRMKRKGSKWQTLCCLGGNYILRDIRTSFFVILTICTGVVLFTGLSYQAKIVKTHQQEIKKFQYLNGQYQMSIRQFEYNTYEGVSREDAQKILTLPGVSSIKTSAQIPIRVIDDGRERNDAYYDNMNALMKEHSGFELAGHDGVDQVFRSNLCGYNTEALKKLNDYVISGSFDAEKGLKQDEIIVGVLSLDDTKDTENENADVSWYKNGSRLMPYKAGDKIKIKYGKDLHLGETGYVLLEDDQKEYIYKEYNVAAVVYFEYMCNVDRRNLYPLLITDDKNIKEIAEDGCYQCIYIDGKPSMTSEQQKELERELIQIGNKGEGGVASRSMAAEIRQNDMFYRKQMIYVCGIAVITFILVLINMMNNIIYRMQARTREICMLRAIGMSISMTKKIQMFENGILGCIAVFIAYFLSLPVLRYLYGLSDMEVNGYRFSYDYTAFFVISGATLLLCMGLSRKVLKSWKTKQIMEAIGKCE